MDSPEVTLFTEKRHGDAMEHSIDAIGGLSRIDTETARTSKASLVQWRERLGGLRSSVFDVITEERDALAALKVARKTIDTAVSIGVKFGRLLDVKEFDAIDDTNAPSVVQDVILPQLARIDTGLSRELKLFIEKCVKDFAHCEKTFAKVTEKADAARARWSDAYTQVVDGIRDCRALQVARGLDVTMLRKPSKKSDGSNEPEAPVNEPATTAPSSQPESHSPSPPDADAPVDAGDGAPA